MPKVLQIASKIEALPNRQQIKLFEILGPWLGRMELATGEKATLEELREARFAGGLKCPHCESTEIQRCPPGASNATGARRKRVGAGSTT